MTQPSAQHSWTEQEPDNLLLATVLCGTEHLSDAQLLSSLLRQQDLHRAEEALRSENLNTLVHAGPVELKALGFHADEITRLLIVLELTARVIQLLSSCTHRMNSSVTRTELFEFWKKIEL